MSVKMGPGVSKFYNGVDEYVSFRGHPFEGLIVGTGVGNWMPPFDAYRVVEIAGDVYLNGKLRLL